MDHWRSWLPVSLGFRLLLLLFLTVGVVLGVHSVMSYRATKAHSLEIVRDSADRCGGLIRWATHDGMLLDRPDEVQSVIQNMTEGPGVRAIRVYDKEGSIVFSSRRAEITQTIAIDSETCRSCHGINHTTQVGIIERYELSSAPEGEELLHHLSVIPNEAQCAASGCHASVAARPVLGVLEVEMTTELVQKALRASRAQMLVTALALLILTGVASGVFIHRMVARPVARLSAGTRRIAAGELGTRIDVRGRHELAKLADAFNKMSQDLHDARTELTLWSQKLEEKVVDKTQELQRAQRQVVHMERMASLGKLSATVAHELNNPISGMLNYTRLIQRELKVQPLADQARAELDHYLTFLAKECSRCGSIVSNLLLFARKSSSEMKSVDLTEVIEQSVMLIQHHLQVSGIELQRDTEGDLRLVGNAGELQQALVALMVNAVEAMAPQRERGGILRLWARGEADSVRLAVEDNGPGIPEELLPRIFEPFFSTKHEESGVGLGLAVVYGIVHRHGGTIQVESQPGRTRFSLLLPRLPKLSSDENGAVAPAVTGEPDQKSTR